MNDINKCDKCGGPGNIDTDHMHEGLLICLKCWPEYAEENGLCENCGSELEAIWENNGFEAPDPTHYEISGYKPCQECNQQDDEE